LQELIKKLGEEYEEFKADVSVEELEKACIQKAKRRGAFKDRIFLEKTEE